MTARHSHAVFLDPTARFVNDAGNLAALLSFDGMHLNPSGYALWADTPRPYH
ncbi:hypothetical protein NNJEOMEG_02978 [Fundidesulfovibrio magnetotacticus]|uniref:SGNH hydrolase-type esterase domain-containing protein n=1 Tax=Fundidesulfovibrio magnetotacticus TaxID=2730080 RepID=A0A6V8LW40_9BACT|nr:hypothetical protein [Fundidesulfovibrio magnetotacticus]GFK95120.1 hypothetical protein NNJEOMEG_02978 [Fundidesulfovibrio magnetotacticus]